MIEKQVDGLYDVEVLLCIRFEDRDDLRSKRAPLDV